MVQISNSCQYAFIHMSGGATTNLVGNQTGDDGNAVKCLMSAGEEFVSDQEHNSLKITIFL